jgi:thioredoxin reductase
MIDCLIIGGGPAGLLAAIYLGRYLRSVCLIDAARAGQPKFLKATIIQASSASTD